jgi:hypothetical protein
MRENQYLYRTEELCVCVRVSMEGEIPSGKLFISIYSQWNYFTQITLINSKVFIEREEKLFFFVFTCEAIECRLLHENVLAFDKDHDAKREHHNDQN